MARKNYFWILLMTILSFLWLAIMLANIGIDLFVKEFFLTMLFLIIVGIGFYAMMKKVRLAWLLFAAFFATMAFNMIYLYSVLMKGGLLLIFALLTGAIGFVLSVSGISYAERMPGEKPKTIIVDAPKKTVEKAAATPAKKRGRKPGPKPQKKTGPKKKPGPKPGRKRA